MQSLHEQGYSNIAGTTMNIKIAKVKIEIQFSCLFEQKIEECAKFA